MKFSEVDSIVRGIPWIGSAAGEVLYHRVLDLGRLFRGPLHGLELGFSQGKSTCYIAAALDELGNGSHLTSVDLEASGDRSVVTCTAEDALNGTGLAHVVTLVREVNSYTWFLKKKIEQYSPYPEHWPPRSPDAAQSVSRCPFVYHFCFIDGGKNWATDGFAFLLVDKLLHPGGWVLFDDYQWSYLGEAGADGIVDGISLRGMSQDQLEQPNIELICRLLVAQHGGYELAIQDKPDEARGGPDGSIAMDRGREQWAWATKRTLSAAPSNVFP